MWPPEHSQNTVWLVWSSPPIQGSFETDAALTPPRGAHGRHSGCWRCTERGLYAVQAEQGRSADGAYRKGVAVTVGAPISHSADGVLISIDSKEAGLWLWQGEAPPPPALPRPKSGARQFLRSISPAARWAGWIAVPAGLALAFLAVSMIPRPDRPVSADTPAAALSSAPSPTLAHPVVAVPPPELKEAQW